MINRVVAVSVLALLTLTGCSDEPTAAPPATSTMTTTMTTTTAKVSLPAVGTDLTAEFSAHAKTKQGTVAHLSRAEIADGKSGPVMRIVLSQHDEAAEEIWWHNEAVLWQMAKGYSGEVEVYDTEGNFLFGRD